MLDFLRGTSAPAPAAPQPAPTPAPAPLWVDEPREQLNKDVKALEMVLGRNDRVNQDEIIALLRRAVALLNR